MTSLYKHILLPTDGSELSGRAIEHGVALAKALGARVTGLSVVLPAHAPAGVGTAILGEHVLESAAADYLEVIADAARAAGVEFECFYASGDSPHEEIVAAAEKRGCDLICMGSHGRRGLAAILMGSQTSSILAESRIPVLVVH